MDSDLKNIGDEVQIKEKMMLGHFTLLVIQRPAAGMNTARGKFETHQEQRPNACAKTPVGSVPIDAVAAFKSLSKSVVGEMVHIIRHDEHIQQEDQGSSGP